MHDPPRTLFVKSYLPVLEERCRQKYNKLSHHQREEATQEARCHSWQIVVASHKKKTPKTVARFAMGRFTEGRPFCGRSVSVTCSALPQEMVDPKQVDPAHQVQQEMDYHSLMQRLEPLEKQVLLMLSQGYTQSYIARTLHVTPRKIHWITHHTLAAELIRTFGVDIIPRRCA